MGTSIRLGRILGVEVGFNWSLVFFCGLVAWTLATDVLPQVVGGYAALLYWLVGAAGAVVFVACLLAHELSHAVVARRFAVKVSGITLWLFGGVARLDGEPATPRAEALIAGVGPLTSLVVAAIAAGIALLAQPNALLSAVFAWLALVNVALALFNLVPAFPLDGGRLLSAFLWWRAGSRRRGVHLAVRVGRVFAYLMIAAGVVEAFLGLPINGIWLVLIGLFLLSAGASEETGTTVRALLRSVPVSAAMTSPVVTLPDWVSVEQFLESVAPSHPFTTYPIHDPSGRLTGVVRLGDLVRLGRAEREARHLIDVARPIAGVPTTTPSEDLSIMIQRIGPAIEQRVLVFADGQLVGIVSPADVTRVLAVRQSLAGAQKG